MLYNEYGTTGIQVSRIGFGGMRFPDQEDREACAQLVRTAYDQGITYFDTAIGYGKSEELFGLAFREMRKTRAERPFYVSTKTFQSDESLIRKELETSLTRLQLDCIDFYHIWCVMNLNAYEERKQHGILKTFQKLKEEGLIRNICISTHMTGPDVARLMDDYPFAGVLLGYSAMNFKFRDAGLAAAARKGAGVVVMNPLGGGIIPRFPDRFSFVKTRADETVVQGALRFLLNDSRITVSLVGFSNAAQVAEAVAAVDGFQPLAPATVEQIRAGISGAFNELCTGCQYCVDCPQEIPIPKLMDAYNHYLLEGKDDAMFNRLRWHWSITPEDLLQFACSECGHCEGACTQKLPILARLKTMREKAAARVARQP